MNSTPPSPRALAARTLVVLLASTLMLSACAGKRAEEQRHDLRGKIVGVDVKKQQITVEHEEIKGYMPAMTMTFPLRDPDALRAAEVGDHIQATLVVSDDAYWLESPAISKAIKSGASGGLGIAPSDPEAARGRPEAEDITAPAGPSEPQPGAEVPDVKLVNQDGRTLSTRQLKGRALLVTFIYTRCPLPDYCPLMSANFAQLNAAIGADPELKKRAHLLSVTLDPEYDRPEILKGYGATYAGGRFDNWDFATGDPAQVRRLAEFFGLVYKAEGDQVIHSLRTALVTPDGRLHKLYRGNEWKPDEVLSDLRNLPAA